MSSLQEKSIVLITTKDTLSRGGVSSYYRLFVNKYADSSVAVELFVTGSRAKDYYQRTTRTIRYICQYMIDMLRFCLKVLRDRRIRIVQISPSLIPVPLVRDGTVALLSRLFRRKVIVFFRGWRDDVASSIEVRPWLRRLFRWVYGSTDAIIVLADEFAVHLVNMGLSREKLHVSRTMFDGDAVVPRKTNSGRIMQFLFLSRICPSKGVNEILEAAYLLRSRGLSFRLDLYGHGVTDTMVSALQEKVNACSIADSVLFHDYVDGPDKFRVYADADVYLLPSYHEGCPNSVLEAMASGCCVISTNVGALKEIVTDGLNGRIVRIQDATDLADKMEWAIKHAEEICEIGRYNSEYAYARFESKVITAEIGQIYERVLNGR